MAREDFIQTTFQQAKQSSHIFADYATCEAALESNFGSSKLAIEGNNLFGTKQHRHPEFGDLIIPTNEFLDGKWVVVSADWIKYPTLAACFEDRMETVRRLATMYPHYAAALAAPDGSSFVIQVSQTWSTDPRRAQKVLSIYDQFKSLFVPIFDAGIPPVLPTIPPLQDPNPDSA